MKMLSMFVPVLCFAAVTLASEPAAAWISTPAKVPDSSVTLKLKDGKQIFWSPEGRGLLSHRRAQGPVDKKGAIQVGNVEDGLGVGSLHPVTFEYLKTKMELKPGFHAFRIQLHDGKFSDWIVVEVK